MGGLPERFGPWQTVHGHSRGGLTNRIHLACDGGRDGHRQDPRHPPRAGTAPHPARAGGGRQGLLGPILPRLPAQTRNQGDHPRARRPARGPTRTPRTTRSHRGPRRAATRAAAPLTRPRPGPPALLRRPLPRPHHRRVLLPQRGRATRRAPAAVVRALRPRSVDRACPGRSHRNATGPRRRRARGPLGPLLHRPSARRLGRTRRGPGSVLRGGLRRRRRRRCRCR